MTIVSKQRRHQEFWAYQISSQDAEWFHHLFGSVEIRRLFRHEVNEGLEGHMTLIVGIHEWHDPLKVSLALFMKSTWIINEFKCWLLIILVHNNKNNSEYSDSKPHTRGMFLCSINRMEKAFLACLSSLMLQPMEMRQALNSLGSSRLFPDLSKCLKDFWYSANCSLVIPFESLVRIFSKTKGLNKKKKIKTLWIIESRL